MTRLPIVGSDDNTWGDILNSFLEVSHNDDGSLKLSALTSAGGESTANKGVASGYASLDSNGNVPSAQLGNVASAPVTSVAGRTGAITLAESDITNLSTDLAAKANSSDLASVATSGSYTDLINTPSIVNTFNTRSGAVTPQSGDYTAAQVTNAADKSSASQQTFSGNVSAPAYVASGLTGATAASRYVGATTSGAPVSGTFVKGDYIADQTGTIWICTTAGSPGTWGKVGGGVTSFNSATGAVTQSNGYGITGANSNPPTPAVSLTWANKSSTLSPASIGTSVTELASFTLSSLAGTFLIICHLILADGSTTDDVTVDVWLGTSSASTSGYLAGASESFAPVSGFGTQRHTVTVMAIASLSASQTLYINGQASDSSVSLADGYYNAYSQVSFVRIA